MASHFRSEIKFGNGSKENAVVYWTTKPPRTGKAILFIHGFWGSAVGTWCGFEHLLLLEPKCQDRDIIFYGYDGIKTYAEESAQDFHDFLKRLCTNAHSVFQDSYTGYATRDPNFQYDEVLVVGHSLGAVVARRALLTGFATRMKWLGKIRLVLFAPAHNGTHTVGWVSRIITGFLPRIGSVMVPLFERNCRAARDLMMGSVILSNLRSDMTTALAKPNSAPLCARGVVWAQGDDVVINGVFPGDAKPDHPPTKKNHLAVCKPKGSFQNPLLVVRRFL
jgi:pimeloyl-ACP methyl ester carboxylesterase